MWNKCNCTAVWTFFGTALLWDWNENSLQFCGHCWVFQTCWYTECSTLITWYFRTLNSLAGIPSPPLALFIAMLPKAHLTSQSSTTGSRWLTTSLWLSRTLRISLCSFTVYSCYLVLISFASVRSLLFLSYNMPILARNIPLVSSPIFLKIFLVIFHSIVFVYFFALFR